MITVLYLMAAFAIAVSLCELTRRPTNPLPTTVSPAVVAHREVTDEAAVARNMDPYAFDVVSRS